MRRWPTQLRTQYDGRSRKTETVRFSQRSRRGECGIRPSDEKLTLSATPKTLVMRRREMGVAPSEHRAPPVCRSHLAHSGFHSPQRFRDGFARATEVHAHVRAAFRAEKRAIAQADAVLLEMRDRIFEAERRDVHPGKIRRLDGRFDADARQFAGDIASS